MSVNISNDEVRVQLTEALKLYQKGDNQGALDAYERILAHSPDHVDALNMAGATAFQGGDVGRALG